MTGLLLTQMVSKDAREILLFLQELYGCTTRFYKLDGD
jgi:hypothetical protein